MNTQYDSFNLLNGWKFVRNRQPKPPSGEVRPEDDIRLQKIDYECVVWVVSCVTTILGVVRAALSEQPLFWLEIWPMPVTFVSMIFVFFRQGFHLEDGVLVLGRRRSAIR